MRTPSTGADPATAAEDAWHSAAAAALAALSPPGPTPPPASAVEAALALDAEAGGLGGSLPPAGAARLKRAADELRAVAGAARAAAAPAFAFPAAVAAAPAAPAAPAPAPALPPPPPPPPTATVAGLTGETLVLGPAALNGDGGAPASCPTTPVALTLARLSKCTVLITPTAAVASLTLTDLADCTVIVGVSGEGGGGSKKGGPAAASAPPPRTVMVEGAARCSLYLAAGQVRVHRAVDCDLYTRGGEGLTAAGGAPAPVLEGCGGVRVAPYCLPGEESGGEGGSGGGGGGAAPPPWAAPQDFDWPRAGASPHWCVLPPGERQGVPRVEGVAEAGSLPGE